MTKLIKIVVIIVVACTFLYLYPEVMTHISQPLNVHSTSLSVNGFYYPINMSQLNKLAIDSSGIVLTGYNVSFYKQSEEFNIVRDYPVKYSKQDSSWVLLDTIVTSTEHCIRTFLHKQSGKEFSVSLPLWNSYPEWITMKNGENEMLLILSSGNWKQGEDVYLGFVEIKI